MSEHIEQIMHRVTSNRYDLRSALLVLQNEHVYIDKSPKNTWHVVYHSRSRNVFMVAIDHRPLVFQTPGEAAWIALHWLKDIANIRRAWAAGESTWRLSEHIHALYKRAPEASRSILRPIAELYNEEEE